MTPPNLLTVSRFFIAPIFIISFSLHTLGSYLFCFLLAAIIELTDFFDGRLARRYQQMSDFGRLMDPFADSASRFSMFLSFLSAGLAPTWMIAIFFYRDVLVSVVRVFAMRQGVVVSARHSGKTKAFVQAVSVFIVLAALIGQKAGWLQGLRLFNEDLHTFTTGVLAVAAAVTLWSAVDYWMANHQSVMMATRIDDGRQGASKKK